MSDRLEMLESTLNLVEEGVVVLDEQSTILFWSGAAETLTGFTSREMLWQQCPPNLCRVDPGDDSPPPDKSLQAVRGAGSASSSIDVLGMGTFYSDSTASECEGADDESPRQLVSMLHKLGHTLPVMLRRVALRKLCGPTVGTALFFFPVEETDALPHGECGEDRCVERSQSDMEDRMGAAYHQWVSSGIPFGVLWITVDQAQSLRKTHGRDACEEMLHTIEQTLLRQMKPAEVIGRWGCNEFLLLTHERSAELLLERAQRLAGLARTADFRWWGDRVGLTVSIGASQATPADTLQSLLDIACQAMHASQYAGGNHVTEARKR
jgi:diguanylate cyclase (GGDEF)-like protein